MSGPAIVLGAVAALAAASSLSRRGEQPKKGRRGEQPKAKGQRVRWSAEHLKAKGGTGRDWEGTITAVESSEGTYLPQNARYPSKVERRHLRSGEDGTGFYPFGTWFYSVRWDQGPGRPLTHHEIPGWKLEVISEGRQQSPQGSQAKLKGLARAMTLLKGGAPKWVRIYDNGGETADRYTIVFTGNYPKERGYSMGIHTAADPRNASGWVEFGPRNGFRWPDGTYQHSIDRPRYSHLGRKIGWDDLPEKVQKMVMADYLQLWKIDTTGLVLHAGRYRQARRSLRGSRAGRRHSADEWVDFFAGGHATEQTAAMGERFSEAVGQIYDEWSMDRPQLQEHVVPEDELAYKTFASLVGHGIGLWDGDVMPRAQGEAFEKHLKTHHPEILRLSEELDMEIHEDEERGENPPPPPPPPRRSLRGPRFRK